MNLKYQRRKLARELKFTKLDLISRKKLAKAILNGFGLHDVLTDLGFKVIKSVPCCEEGCDSWAHVTWEKDGKTLRTNFGVLDIPKNPSNNG